MTTVLLDQIIQTDYGQFSLEWGDDTWDGDVDRFFAGQQNGWVAAAAADVLHVVLARRAGGSSVRVDMNAEEPPDPLWEDCVEVSVTIPDGAQVRWSTWAGEDGGSITIPPGSYRVRVKARGRDEGAAGEFEPDVVDFYLLQLWPSSLAEDAVVRTESADAAYWNREWGSRRG